MYSGLEITKELRRLILALSGSLLLLNCTAELSEFQRYRPDNPVSLRDMLDQIPAIVSMAKSVDSKELEQRGGKLEGEDLEHFIRSLMVWSEAVRVPVPQLAQALWPSVRDSHQYFFNNGGGQQFNETVDFLLDLTRTPKEGVLQPTQRVSELLHYISNSQDLFDIPDGQNFPTMAQWNDCDTDEFSNALPTNDYTDAQRQAILGVYSGLRTINCIFKPGVGEGADFDLGRLLYNYYEYDKNNRPNIEQDMLNRITYINNNSGPQGEIRSMEEKLTDWLIKDPQKKQITDYFTTDFIRLIRNDTLFSPEIGNIVDLQASHFSISDPEHPQQFMLKRVMENIYADASAEKFSHLEDHTPLALDNNGFLSFIRSLFDENSSNSLHAAVNSFGESNLQDLLWNGTIFHNSLGNSFELPGLMNPGTEEATNVINVSHLSHFRLQVHDTLNGDNDGRYTGVNFQNDDDHDGNPLNPTSGLRKRISPSYDGETFFQAWMTNYYLHLLENYYSPVERKWSMDMADGQNFFQNPSRNLATMFSGLQYSLFNAVTMDRNGRFPGEPGFENVPLATAILYAQSITAGVISPEIAPEVMKLQTGLMNQQRPTNSFNLLSQTGVSENDSGLGVGDDGWESIDLRIFSNNGNDGPAFSGDVCNGTNGWGWGSCWNTFAGVTAVPNGQMAMAVYRNGTRIYPDIMSNTLQFLTPGPFQARLGQDPDEPWNSEGGMTSQQGDIRDGKVSTWIQSQIALTAWMGHGPFTFKEKAPNGSERKYKPDYYTDRYSAKLPVRFELAATNQWRFADVPLGNNGGACEGADSVGLGGEGNARDNYGGENYGISNGQEHNAFAMSDKIRCVGYPRGSTGNYHIYEKIYIPQAPEDPCWALATSGSQSVPLQAVRGFLRPSYAVSNGAGHEINPNSTTYATPEGNCQNWQTVQLDVGSRDEAIRLNFEYLLRDKKFAFIVPVTYGESFSLASASAANWWFVMGNGLLGLLKAQMVAVENTGNSSIDNLGFLRGNGRWVSHPGLNALDADLEQHNNSNNIQYYTRATGLVPNGTNGILSEDAPGNGATVTRRFARTSFEPEDSSVFLDMTMKVYGAATLLGKHAYAKLAEQLKTKPLIPKLVTENAKVYSILTATEYSETDIVAGGPATSNFDKFEVFYQRYAPGMWQDYQNGTLTAADMPPIPRVNGVSYPGSFDANGNPVNWAVHTGRSEGKFSSLITPLVMMMGTAFEGNSICTGPVAPDGSCPGPDAGSQANSDNLNIEIYKKDGFRQYSDEGTEKLVALAATTSVGSELTSDADILPAYSNNSLVNRLIESSPGARNGPLPYILSSRYFNVFASANLREDVNTFINDSIRSAFNNFASLAMTPDIAGGENISNMDRLRYFMTDGVVGPGQPFQTNYLAGAGGDPAGVIKLFFDYMRSLEGNDEVVSLLQTTVARLNNLSEISESDWRLDLEGDKLTTFLSLFTDTNSEGEYVLDAAVDFIRENELDDLATLTTIDFTNLDTFLQDAKGVFDDVNSVLMAENDKDLRRKILLGKLIDEPYHDANSNGIHDAGEPYFDENGNGAFDKGIFRFRDYDYDTATAGEQVEYFHDVLDDNGITYEVDTPIPNFFNIHAYDLYIQRSDEAVPTTDQDVNEAIDFIQTFNLNTELTDLKNDALGKILDERKINEPWRDDDGDGVADWGEFADINGDLVWTEKTFSGEPISGGPSPCGGVLGFLDLNCNGRQDGPVTIRRAIEYYSNKYVDVYDKLNDAGTLNFALKSMRDIFSPDCQGLNIAGTPYPGSSLVGTPQCLPQNPQYLTAHLGNARSLFKQHITFDPDDLMQAKNTLAEFLYRREEDGYQHIISNAAMPYAANLQLNVGFFAVNRDKKIKAFQDPEGPARYALGTVSLGVPYQAFDILKDLRTLSDMQVIYEYHHQGTFWYQLSEVLKDYSSLAYKQKDMDYTLNQVYFDRFSELFK